MMMPAIDRKITARRLKPRAPEQLSRYWFGESEFETAFFSCLNLFIPPGEEFFIRTLRDMIGELETRLPEDRRLLEAARAFMAQEGQHAAQHRMLRKHLRQYDVDVDPYLEWLDAWFAWFDRHCSPESRLSIVAALEHLTAAFADTMLRNDILIRAEPNARNMMMWHAAEEIEHKSVSFDLLVRLAPGYPLRVAGLIGALPFLTIVAGAGMIHILHQDRSLYRPRTWARATRFFLTGDRVLLGMGAYMLSYLRPGFHPNHHLNEYLVQEVLENESVVAELC